MDAEAPASASTSTSTERYTYLRELGRGATGVVDLVYDQVRAAPVARKRMHHLNSETRFRIKQEFRQAQELRHPNLVRLHDLFADDSGVFFTMEPVFGSDVSRDVQAASERCAPNSNEVIAIVLHRLRQLGDAVAALHAAGIVHRDIKPSNVLVEDNGRLVLLDFGFSSPLTSDFKESEDHALVGTIPYMAPECLWGAPPSAQSDWYGVGVIAAELLLGRPLFSGSLQEVIRNKDRPPESFAARVPGLPAALDALICALLRRDPGARPHDALEILAALGSSEPATRVATRVSGTASGFVGRTLELAQLERGIPLEPRAQVVRVHGPSGIGKTALLRELTARLNQRPSWVVFRGRCHPREHLALKTLDALMDEVSRHLKHLGPRACLRIAALEGMGALTKMFPALARVPEFATVDAAPDPADPQTRWIDSLRAFRSLWSALAAIDRIAVWIDDLQWADKDGLKLLHEVIAVEPRLPITWIFSHRSTSVSQAGDAALISKEVPDGSFELALGGLVRADATELAIRFGASRQVAGEVERESGGSPFIISELTRSALTGGGLASVESVLEDRLRALDVTELAVVEHLALAGGPFPVDTLASLFAETNAITSVLERLENARLVRITYGGDSEELAEAFHDRIHEAVAARMSEPSRRAVHIRLAEALTARVPSVTRAAIAFHYRRAGVVGKGLALTLAAAEECTQTLAFEQAAELYEEALAIHPEPIPPEIFELAAAALARAGRCEDAAGRYLKAAATVEGQRKRAFQLQAGAHFLYAGRIQEGRQILEAVMREHGVTWPKRPVLTSLWQRTRVLLAGTEGKTPRKAVDAVLGERFDALCAVAKGTVMVEPATGDAFALASLREALRLGDPARLIWALGHEAASEANIGGRRMHQRARALLAQVKQLAEQTGDPSDRAFVHMAEGIVNYFQGECVQAEHALREARRLYRHRHTEFLHDQNVAACFLIAALEQQGNVRALAELLSDLRASAQHTGNLYTSFLYRIGSAGLIALAEDRTDDAIREADDALAAWPMTQFTAQHHYHFQVTLWARLYAGRASDAWQQVERTWPQLEAAHFLRLDAVGIQHRHLRARAALSAVTAGSLSDRRRLCRIAAKDAAIIGKSGLPQASPVRAAIEYGVALAAGDPTLARQHCEAAVAGFDRAHMSLGREVARLRLAGLCTDAEQRDRLERQAGTWFAAAGVHNPAAMASSLMPSPTAAG